MEGVWRKTMLMLGVMALLSAHCMAQLTCEPQTSVFGFDETPAVAMDGPVAIIGFPVAGHVFLVEKLDSGRWGEWFHFIGDSGSHFGAAVSVSERLGVAVVGAPLASGGGMVQVIVRDGNGEWEEGPVLRGDGVPATQAYGAAVAIAVGSPNSKSNLATLVVGAPETVGNGVAESGGVFIYSSVLPATTLSTWTLEVTDTGTQPMGWMGASVALSKSATNVLVGEPGAGRVTVWGASPADGGRTWEMLFRLQPDVPESGYGATLGTWGSTTENGNPEWSQQGVFAGMAKLTTSHLYSRTTFNMNGVDYNQTFSAPNPSLLFGAAVASEHNMPGGCILPVVGAPQKLPQEKKWYLPSGLSSSKTASPSMAYSFMYQNGYGNPWQLNTTISSEVVDSKCDTSTFGSTIAVANGTAIIGSGGCVTFWCTGVVCG